MGWEDACPPVGLPELLYSSTCDSLDQRHLACPPPPEFLLDDPTYLPLVQLDHVRKPFNQISPALCLSKREAESTIRGRRSVIGSQKSIDADICRADPRAHNLPDADHKGGYLMDKFKRLEGSRRGSARFELT